jgi:hypothetical protein
MKPAYASVVLSLMLAVGLPLSALQAEEGAKPLPVLLIKGEIVSLDTNDPTAALLKVKDRYGFETPIYVTPEAKITQGETAVPITNLSTGISVDVEYNFDVNTAKRHAVTVKAASAAAQAAVAAPAPAAEAAPAAEPAAPALATPEPAAPAIEAPAEPAPSSTEEAPASP